MHSIKIRKFSRQLVLKYLKELINMDRECFKPYNEFWGRNNFLKEVYLKEKLSYFIFCNNELGGYLIGSAYNSNAHINRIAVKNEFQGKGLGKKLLGEFTKSAKKLGLKILTLSTKNMGDKGAVHFYEKNGFKKLKTKKDVLKYLKEKNKENEINNFYPTTKVGKYVVFVKKI